MYLKKFQTAFNQTCAKVAYLCRHLFTTQTVFIIFFSLFSICREPAAETAFRFGVVPQFEVLHIQKIWGPVLTEVSKISGVQLRLVPSPSIPDFEKSFEKGEYDLAYMNPYHLLVANKFQAYTPVLKDNGRWLYGIIVVPKESLIKVVTDLNGKTIAFPSPNALGAALIPRAEFANKFRIEYTPKYVKSHTSVYLNVMLGQVDAGGGVQSTLNRQKPEIQETLRVLYETVKVSPHPIAVHPRVDTASVERIRNAFLELGRNEKGRQLLEKIPIKNIGLASMDDYLELKSLGLEQFYVTSGTK
jgi:ABC-type phosphate/phosphonate transport system substrate-binding protein